MQTAYKKHPGAINGSQIIFMLSDPQHAIERHQTGCVISAWQTNHKGAYIDAAGEQRPLNGLMVRYVGSAGDVGAMLLLVDAPRDKLEDTLANLHDLPDDGVDLSMVQPMFSCTVDGANPGRRGRDMQQLKLARLIIRG